MVAADRKQLAVVEELLKILPENSDEANRIDLPTLCTPLIYAAWAGSSSIVECLLKCSKVDINLADLQNQTALHYAVRGNHIQVVRLLLDKGIDPNRQDDSHAGTPLIDAAALVSWISRVPFSISISCFKWGLGWFSGI